MSLRSIEIVDKYDSGVQNIVEEFYLPTLKECISYDRIAGFFTSTSLLVSFRGLESLIKNHGKIRLIVSPKLSQGDIDIISCYEKNLDDYLDTCFEDELKNMEIGKVSPADALGWLLANDLIEIKVVLVMKNNKLCTYEEVNESALFHQKIGIMTDKFGNKVSFSGSINETAKAWLENNEEFKTFKSWVEGQYNYCNGDIQKFESYWNDDIKNVKVVPLPLAFKERLISKAPKDFEFDSRAVQKKLINKPSLISLFSYQQEAKQKWLDCGRRMLFEMATGTGKTRTAIACIQQDLLDNKKNFVVICTPEETLTAQWENELEKLGVTFDEVIFATGSYKWKSKLEENIFLQNIGIINNLLVLTTHDTVSSRDYISIYNNLKFKSINTLFVGDEVHGLGSSVRKQSLLESYNHRIGLSATPSRWFDEIGTKVLNNYFNNNSFVFDIEKALNTVNPLTNKFFLCNYYYNVEKVLLNEKEMFEFKELSDKISKRNFIKKKNDEDDDDHLLEEQRANIVKSAKNKLISLEDLLLSIGIEKVKNTIIFCSPELIEQIGILLKKLNIKFQNFTKDTGKKKNKNFQNMSERQYIIEQFKQENIQVLVAIKCLDEGIDIPTAQRAILVSSTTNPREYIQRIGRVIRQSDNKKVAYIHDFIVTFDDEFDAKIIDKLERNERNRSLYIAQYAINNATCLNELNEFFKGGLKVDGY